MNISKTTDQESLLENIARLERHNPATSGESILYLPLMFMGCGAFIYIMFLKVCLDICLNRFRYMFESCSHPLPHSASSSHCCLVNIHTTVIFKSFAAHLSTSTLVNAPDKCLEAPLVLAGTHYT